MQTKRLCVLIHICTKGEVGAPLNRFKPSSKIFLLTIPRRCFFCGSFMLVLSCFVMLSCTSVCVLMPCGHLLWKGWPLGSRLWCRIVTLSLSYRYSRVSVVLDCIDPWSLPSFLLRYVLLSVLINKHPKLSRHMAIDAYQRQTSHQACYAYMF